MISHEQANFRNDDKEFRQNGTDGYHPTYYTGGRPYTSSAGVFAANGYGLFDMAGNVGEWCWDWYGNYTSASQTDPHVATSGARRVGRGGGWNSSADYCRIAYRYNLTPAFSYNGIGFRIARSSVP